MITNDQYYLSDRLTLGAAVIGAGIAGTKDYIEQSKVLDFIKTDNSKDITEFTTKGIKVGEKINITLLKDIVDSNKINIAHVGTKALLGACIAVGIAGFLNGIFSLFNKKKE